MWKWRSIETAPIGERILLFDSGYWKGVYIGVGKKTGDRIEFSNSFKFWSGTKIDASHWMPLPDSPPEE